METYPTQSSLVLLIFQTNFAAQLCWITSLRILKLLWWKQDFRFRHAQLLIAKASAAQPGKIRSGIAQRSWRQHHRIVAHWLGIVVKCWTAWHESAFLSVAPCACRSSFVLHAIWFDAAIKDVTKNNLQPRTSWGIPLGGYWGSRPWPGNASSLFKLLR